MRLYKISVVLFLLLSVALVSAQVNQPSVSIEEDKVVYTFDTNGTVATGHYNITVQGWINITNNANSSLYDIEIFYSPIRNICSGGGLWKFNITETSAEIYNNSNWVQLPVSCQPNDPGNCTHIKDYAGIIHVNELGPQNSGNNTIRINYTIWGINITVWDANCVPAPFNVINATEQIFGHGYGKLNFSQEGLYKNTSLSGYGPYGTRYITQEQFFHDDLLKITVLISNIHNQNGPAPGDIVYIKRFYKQLPWNSSAGELVGNATYLVDPADGCTSDLACCFATATWNSTAGLQSVDLLPYIDANNLLDWDLGANPINLTYGSTLNITICGNLTWIYGGEVYGRNYINMSNATIWFGRDLNMTFLGDRMEGKFKIVSVGDLQFRIYKFFNTSDTTATPQGTWYFRPYINNTGNLTYVIYNVSIWRYNSTGLPNAPEFDKTDPNLHHVKSYNANTYPNFPVNLDPGNTWSTGYTWKAWENDSNYTANLSYPPTYFIEINFSVNSSYIAQNRYTQVLINTITTEDNASIYQAWIQLAPWHVYVRKTVVWDESLKRYNITLFVKNIGTQPTPSSVRVYDFIPENFTAYDANPAFDYPGAIAGNTSVSGPITVGWNLGKMIPDQKEIITYWVNGTGTYHAKELFVVGIDPSRLDGAVSTVNTNMLTVVATTVSGEVASMFVALLIVVAGAVIIRRH